LKIKTKTNQLYENKSLRIVMQLLSERVRCNFWYSIEKTYL